MKELYDKVSLKCSKLTTRSYSTSFSLGIRFLNKEFHDPIYAIYGYVRFADEIVDTFHAYDKKELLDEFRNETYKALDRKISLNPILHCFQETFHKYNLNIELVNTFLDSMEMDLTKNQYFTKEELDKYVLGSAEVVGLMCLKVFTRGDQEEYERLKFNAMQLGSAFQKINFLRDLKADYKELGRSYFPQADFSNFDIDTKRSIENQIQEEFQNGFEGIKELPKGSQFGVYVAYVYFYALFNKIRNTPPTRILEERIRIPNNRKMALLVSSYFKHSLRLI
jgi:phytoene/squalene synthetase